MSKADAAMLIALISFFLAVVIWVRLNELETKWDTQVKEKKAEIVDARKHAVLAVTHHRSGERPRGAFLLHNAGKVAAEEITLTVHRYQSSAPTPVIPGNVAVIDRLDANRRIQVDTTTDNDDVWPVEVLLTWRDPRGAHSEIRNVSR